MKKCVLTSLFLIIFSAVSSAQTVYYLKAELDGKQDIMGRYPAVSAQNTTCYRFVYDDKNKLLSVERIRNEKPIGGSFYGGNVSKVRIEYMPWFVKYSFYDMSGNPACSSAGEYSLRFKVDEKGDKESCFVYGKDGQLCENNNGVAQFLYSNDNSGRIKKVIMAGKNGEQKADINGVYTILKSYDGQGRLLEIKYYAKDGRPVAGDKKYSRAVYVYDDRSNVIEEKYLSSGEGYVNKSDLEFLALKAAGAWNYLIGASYVDSTGQITESFPSDLAEFKAPADLSSFEAKQFFDKVASLKRELIPRQDIGVCRRTTVFDAIGNPVEERFYGSKGQLVSRSDMDVALIRRVYSDTGNLSREAYFGIDEQPKDASNYGMASMLVAYDSENRPVEYRYYGIDGALKERKDIKFAVVKIAYLSGDSLVQNMFFDAKEQPIVNSDGYCGKKISYDEKGAVTEEAYLDKDAKPSYMPKLGYAIVRNKRDTGGNIVEERYFTVDSNMLWTTEKLSESVLNGVAVIKRTFDDKGRLVEESYYGADEQPKQPIGKTYDYVKYTYDSDGKVVNTVYVKP